MASGARLNTADGRRSFLVSYGLGSAAPGKVVLSQYIAVNAPENFAQWLAKQEVTGPDNDAADDPNSDGVENLNAYFRGRPYTAERFQCRAQWRKYVVTLRSPRTVTGVTLSSKVSSDLLDWQDGPAPVLTGTTPTRNIYQITLSGSVPRKFARFNFTLN